MVDSHAKHVAAPARKGGKGWKVLLAIALAVFLCAAGMLAYIGFSYWAGQKQYDGYQGYVHVDKSNYTLADFKVDWDALSKINPDVCAWVYIPGTPINYPVVFRENGEDYYMTHSFDGSAAGPYAPEYGCPVLSNINSPQFTDQMSFIAGHHLMNGSMFAYLQDMLDSAAFNEHRTMYLLTPRGNFRTTAFAIDKVPGTSQDTVIANFGDKQEFVDYLNRCIRNSAVQPSPQVSTDSINQVIALYTCSDPDSYNRILLYCSVDEFLPAGSTVAQGSAVSGNDVKDVASASGKLQ